MDTVTIIVGFVGGLGMFIYGMQIMAQGLENAAGNKMKSLLEALTKNKFMGVLLGAAITAVIQSSSGTTVMVVGFVNAGIMNLTQAMGVIMGANVGTTVTGWLVSSSEWAQFLSPDKLAPVALMIGVILLVAGKGRNSKHIANVIIGFGLLFIGITTMSASVAPLRDAPVFKEIFVTLGNNPILGILAGMAVTALIQSSSASLGILQSLAAVGLVPFSAAVYIIMGQNIGTCVTAILSSVGAKKNAKTAAIMHLLFNIIGSVTLGILAVVYLEIINPAAGTGMISQTQISIVHTSFNIITTIMLFPASNIIIKLAKKIARVDDSQVDASEVQLDDRMLETPGIALQSAVNEVIRLGDSVMESLEISRSVMFTQKAEDIEKLKEMESVADKLTAGISNYIIKLNTKTLSNTEHQDITHMLQIVSDMERVSDYTENISEFAEHLKESKTKFSDTGKEQLENMLEVCIKSYEYALESFRSNDKEAALKVIEEETKADDLEIELREMHIQRLANNECSAEAGIVFLDALVCLERISDHARNIAEEVLKRA
ncbi:MAG: Na/Pi cotransporter family protein [Suipraeoptans sp.]